MVFFAVHEGTVWAPGVGRGKIREIYLKSKVSSGHDRVPLEVALMQIGSSMMQAPRVTSDLGL